MNKRTLKIVFVVGLAIAALTPPAYSTGKGALDFIYSNYLVMAVQMDSLRLWCL